MRKLKRKRSFYNNLDMFSKIKSQVSQRLFEAKFDVSISSHDIEKQTIYKKKKVRFDNLSFSNIKSILTNANVLRIIDNYHNFAQIRTLSTIYDQNSIKII